MGADPISAVSGHTLRHVKHSDAWLSERQLIDAAGQPEPTRRQLESWRSKGLLPRPVRCHGGRAVWRYPPAAAEQLRRLLHWRRRVPDLELVRIMLWLEDFPL